uniref:KH domain-containing protein n=1 Tax=Heterorhabditis bacteriophora TaxID=37862 RepID=A0A1I7XCE2_HETBA
MSEISRVISIMSDHLCTEDSSSEEYLQEKVVLSEMIMIPVEDFPKYNFVGRILGPRGMTAKQLEEDTGCKIMVRGRGSSRMNGSRRDRSNDLEPLHVLIQCEDFKNRAQSKMKNAIQAINQLLNPPPEGKDELKRKQLIELSIINGTYRPTSATKVALREFECRIRLNLSRLIFNIESPRPSSAAHLPSVLDESPSTETARILSSLIDPSNKIMSSINHSKKMWDFLLINYLLMNISRLLCLLYRNSIDDTYGSMAQLLYILNPIQQAININPTLAAEYYKSLFSYSLSDPSVISAIMCANHPIDPYGLSNSLSPNTVHLDNRPHATGSPIPQANLQQYLTAAAILNSVPYIHDGSGDAPKVKR